MLYFINLQSAVFSTVVCEIALNSILNGIFFLAVGWLKVGGLIRFIPYPVVGGFWAGIGWLLVKGGIKVTTNIGLSWVKLPDKDIAQTLGKGYDVDLLTDGFKELSNYLQLDYLLLDIHPGLNEETLFSIGISDVLLIILRPDQQDYLGTAVVLEVAEHLEVPQVLLVVNKALPELDFNALRQQVEETYQKAVAGVLPLSNEMLRLGSEGIFCLRYPEHELTAELNKIVSHMKI